MAVNKVIYNGDTLVDLTSDTISPDTMAAGVTAHAADGTPIIGLLPKVEIDSELSNSSTNPVQNKVINSALGKCAKTNTSNTFSQDQYLPIGNCIRWQRQQLEVGSIGYDEYTGRAAKAKADGDGNTISTTYAKLASENTWSALQIFDTLKINNEKYNIDVTAVGSRFTPTHAVEVFSVGSNLTLDLSVLANTLAVNEAMVVTCNIGASSAYALTITGVGSVTAVGSVDDIAIGEKGTLLNILLWRTSYGTAAIAQGTAFGGDV